MLSNRVILIFLGVIFLIIIVLSSQRLSQGIRKRLAGVFPNVQPVPTVSLKPETTPTLSPTPTASHFTAANTNQGQNLGSSTYTQTPGTGADIIQLAFLSFLGAGGVAIKRFTKAS